MGLPVSESLIRPVIDRDRLSVRRISPSLGEAGCWKTPLYPDLSALISTASAGASSQRNRPSASEARKTPSARQPRQVSILTNAPEIGLPAELTTRPART